MNLQEVIRYPIITEKSEEIKGSEDEKQRYTLKVHAKANKELVRQALHNIYRVKTVKINIMNVPGKKKRYRNSRIKLSSWKKAIVTLASGQTIDFAKKS